MSEQEQVNEMAQEAPARRGIGRRLVDRLFAPWMKEINTAPYDWQQDAHRAFVEQQPLRARALLYVIALIVIGLVVWASLAKIDEVTRGQGKVIPSRQVQVIQSQDGGVVNVEASLRVLVVDVAAEQRSSRGSADAISRRTVSRSIPRVA